MLSSQCFENPPSKSTAVASGGGSVQEIGGLTAYINGPSDSKLAILFINDAFGFESPNLRKLADKVAAAGYFVVVPDFFYGDPYDPNDPHFDIQAWFNKHNTVKGFEDARAVIAAVKSKGVSAVGATGYCWGGMVAVKLAGTDEINAAVASHPGPITEDEINQIKVPTAILGAEFDSIFPAEKLKHFEQMLSTKSEVDSMVKIFPGVGHGWTMRYNDEDEAAVKSAQEAHDDMFNWLTKYVK
ncbi:endo-1,3;1,4-beta-D-glucanase-like [Hibiscus syriacus]|uniref:endo-1,3;1,4-beta-D-glucanase-like n=1 Tax=Hibiscus syriacus TaxID=106335 RepID=UPI0019232260|nr:endo-1,3;1,4-beta-D-glucanase-like [Hibiscus syriacus]